MKSLGMNTHGITRLGAIALLLSAQLTGALAITFTQDTIIGSSDFSYEGADIVVTNCTLTVDGPHLFHSLQVQNAGVLTHSANTNGPQQFTFFVANEPHVMSATNPTTLFNANVDPNTITVLNASKTTIYTEGVDYLATSSGQSVQLNLTTNSAIAEGATVLVSYDWVESIQGFTLYINNGVTVQAGGAINVSGKGYAGGLGTNIGAGTSQLTNNPISFFAGAGGGHGGAGGISSSFARGGASYDSTANPASPGSGGGAGSGIGGAGGGSATILAGGNFQIDGLVSAAGMKGTNLHSGGGGGGSLLLSADTFSGSGIISANGGGGDTPDGGGGGGGRIALFFGTNNFSGTLTAFGGGGFMSGGAGTIYLQADGDTAGQVLIVNAGKQGTNTSFSGAIRDLTVGGGAIAQVPVSSLIVSNLLVRSNSWLRSPDALMMTVTVNGDATVESNAVINADFESLAGPGTGPLSTCGAGAGASYGGIGGTSVCGAPGGPVYGEISQPVMGSGSPGSRGGGAIALTVAGTLSLSGRISANGAGANTIGSGSASGGGIRLAVGTLTGSGIVSANGGSATNLVCGGGGGGRIAIFYDTNLFAGAITAFGGTGTNSGGPGSIYLKSNSSNSIPQIIFDNGGIVGASSWTLSTVPADLTISGGAILTNSAIRLRNLFIGSNSLFTGASPATGVFEPIATNATIQAGGALAVEGLFVSAYPIGGQPGGTDISGVGGGGGGGAGYGGGTGVIVNGVTQGAGGIANSQYANPNVPGGPGGSGAGPGGRGGGMIDFIVPGKLQLDGRISVNGLPGTGSNAGGGGGGSIILSAGTISGTGTITANGGNGNGRGGGGGGGAISISTDTNLFSGTITAYGGGFGTNSGGAGTIYLRGLKLEPPSQLIVDNGGNRGAKTPLRLNNIVGDMTVAGGAVVSNGIAAINQIRSLLIGSNSVMLAASSTTFGLSSNLTILAGGSFNADGMNTSQTTGTGASFNATGGGGGAAGTGGASGAGAAGGGAIFDSPTSPVTSGGRGGGGLGQITSNGGNGGGTVRLNVGGIALVDGSISANGTAGAVVNSGGGGGGSVAITTRILSGNGVISANGGAGSLAGGGGGGGHVAISFTSSNFFTGTIEAKGGSGAIYGGAGLVSLSKGQSLFQVKIDNGGVVGAGTPLLSAIVPSSLIVTGGAIVTNSVTIFTLQNLLIGSNSAWFINGNGGGLLTVLTNATVQAGGLLAEYAFNAQGPASGQTLSTRGGGGGGHGGYGGASISNALGGAVTADSMTSPIGEGSPGGSGGSVANFGGFGGGVLQMTVNGTLQLDGLISANGGTSVSNLNSGGGSGGSVWLKVGRLAGTGILSADGGAANNLGGGGGGGRVAVWYNANQFAGSISARGGAGANAGGAGTIYLQPGFNSTNNILAQGRLIFDNGGARGTNSAIVSAITSVDVIITNGTTVALGNPFSVNSTWNNLTITSNSVLNAATNFSAIHLTIVSNLDIQQGGSLTVDGEGSPANTGSGRGFAFLGSGGGGGHGGLGSAGISSNALGGAAYDILTLPTMLGSGGGSAIATSGSAGGGAIQLTVNGTLKVNGVLSANGGDATTAGAGGGSGGSISITAGNLTGSGRISADGGNGDIFSSGGGGGGRVAITFKSQLSSNLFSGTLSARGGAGMILAGGAGTIYLKTNSSSFSQVIVDNGGQSGAITPLSPFNPGIATTSLALHNGAVGDPGASLLVYNLVIDSGASLVGHGSTAPTTSISVERDVLVDTNGAIINDAAGYNPSFGPGAGGIDYYGNGGGGGYGGMGGASITGAFGGATYGSSNQPVDLGGAGGVYASLAGYSRGGGALRLALGGTLTVNGVISADGADGIFDGSGGGAGGSIWITASKFAGNGWLTVNGGMGEGFEGGGGGGGRMAIFTPTNSFAGNLLAFGGEGANPGQDGTIYVPTSLFISGTVTNSNGTAVAGLTLQPTGVTPVSSDANGSYSFAVPPLWSGLVTPIGSGVIVPSVRRYSSMMSNATGQDYTITTPAAFNLSASQAPATSTAFTWYGMGGVFYQPEYSSNLVDWAPYGPPYVGNNAPLSITPPTNSPQLFFRLNVVY